MTFTFLASTISTKFELRADVRRMGAAIVEECGDCEFITIDWTGIDKIRISIAMRVLQELIYVVQRELDVTVSFSGMSSAMTNVFNKAEKRWEEDWL
jgi:hypothetical protein